MTAIALGTYTFAMNPTDMSMVKAKRLVNPIETLGGLETFSFGIFYAGQRVALKWNYMPVAMWTQLLDLEDDDASKVFTPGDGRTYNVQILSLNGEYHIDQASSAVWRKNVELVLVVESLAS
jgi:hypothetical protein